MKNYFDKLPESYKEIIKVTFPFTVIIILFIIVGKFGIMQITSLRSQILDTQKEETILTEKLSVLQSVSQSSIEDVATVTAALPGSSPSLITISQLKRIAAKDGIFLSDIKAGSSTTDTANLSFVNVSFMATGIKDNVLTFLNDTEMLAPIMKIDKVKITESGGIESVNMNIKSYWSPFPKTITTVTQTVTDLSNSEKETLLSINGFLQPFFGILPVSDGGGNTLPFGQ